MCDLPYSSPEVRDLAWSIGSPALLRRTDPGVHWPCDTWFTSLREGFHDTLVDLDVNPNALRDTLARRRDRRLGHYFEALWRYWLEHNTRYHLLHANMPVRTGPRTLGEFDFLVHDREKDRTLHWEVAVKFYLGTGDTTQAANWWGPARRDRLDIKTERLLQHQCRLSQHSEALSVLADQGLHVDESWVIMKGRLFYPLGGTAPPPCGSNPAHLRGFWLPAGQLEKLAPARWMVLDRRQWLAPLGKAAAGTMDNIELSDWWHASRPLYPVCVATMFDEGERERGFIVPDDWERRGTQPL